MPGRKLKPPGLKIIAGTARPDRDSGPGVAIPPLSQVPEVPTWMTNAHAQGEWRRLGPILIANNLLTAGNLAGFSALCSCYGMLIDAASGRAESSAALIGQFRALLADFGLTPASQSRVKLSSPEAKPNGFAKFLTRA